MPSESIVPKNRLKQSLHDGKSLVGTMVAEFRQPSVMQLLANAGFDWVIIDNEHGPFSIETIADLSRAARLHGLTPVVRVPDLSYPHITRPLDAGAQGIMTPRITEAQQVREIVQTMKYPPVGRRGCGLSRGHTDFKAAPVAQVMETSNRETLLIIQMETREALENLEEIVAVEGVDAVLVGPNDFSIALGVAGKMEDPVLVSAIERTIAACTAEGVFPAIHINDLAMAVHWAKKGMRLVSISAEIGFLMKAAREATGELGKAFGRTP